MLLAKSTSAADGLMKSSNDEAPYLGLRLDYKNNGKHHFRVRADQSIDENMTHPALMMATLVCTILQ